MTKAKEGQPFSNGIPLSYHPFFSDRFVMIILFSLQSSFILSPTQNPSACNHCPSNLICGIVLSDLLIFPYTVNVLSFFIHISPYNFRHSISNLPPPTIFNWNVFNFSFVSISTTISLFCSFSTSNSQSLKSSSSIFSLLSCIL